MKNSRTKVKKAATGATVGYDDAEVEDPQAATAASLPPAPRSRPQDRGLAGPASVPPVAAPRPPVAPPRPNLGPGAGNGASGSRGGYMMYGVTPGVGSNPNNEPRGVMMPATGRVPGVMQPAADGYTSLGRTSGELIMAGLRQMLGANS